MKGIGSVYIHEALEKTENCFLCHLENRFEQRYVDNYLYELVMDPEARGKIIRSRGFCNFHFHEMLAYSTSPGGSDGLGMALILRSVIEQLLEDMMIHLRKKSVSRPQSRFKFRGRRRSTSRQYYLESISNLENCPACNYVSGIMRTYIKEFISELGEKNEITDLFVKSRGLCIPHHVMTLDIILRSCDEKSQQTARMIIEKQLKAFEDLRKALSIYVERQDYHFSNKDREGTEKAVNESLLRVAGRRGVERTLTMMLRSEESDVS